MTNRTVLAFMAHPDDAEICCGGTLIQLAALGWRIHIATATAGDCGTMTHTPWEISAIRTAEAAEAAAMIGADYHCLGEADGMVVFDKPALGKTIDLFRRIAPSLVFTHPLRDYMMDHEMVAMLARAASFVYGAPNASGHPRLDQSMIPHLYYCDPADGVGPLGEPARPTTLIDISTAIEKKARLLACHASQRDWLRAHHGMDEYIDAMKRHDADRGRLAGCAYAEAFVQHLGHAYPHDDLLAGLFPAG
jgi:LmbE family N-acetylglucosaminyl deacetylase